MEHLIAVAKQFVPHGCVMDVQEYGSGNVNDTYMVTCDAQQDSTFILQRINTHVFVRPEYIMVNMRTFTEHVRARLVREPSSNGRRWEVPRVFSAQEGQDFFVDEQGSFWRAISFVAGSHSCEAVQGTAHAREAGYALGRFQSLISDLNINQLHDTLEGFHVTPRYIAQYEKALANNHLPKTSPEVCHCLRFVEQRKVWASVLEDACAQGRLVMRPIHGDPKINNIMIDDATGQAVSIVDLDTVKPGLVHYDIGDCLRSCCNPLGEETTEIERVRFETDLCQAILEGYLSEASSFLTELDYAYLYDAIRLIAFELGLRFFTDYLNGNVYFKVRHPEHNLMRALVQFKLAESSETQESGIQAIIQDLRAAK